MNIIASQVQLLSSTYFGTSDFLELKTLQIPKGANFIFGSVVNGVLSVAINGVPNIGSFVPEQWFGHYQGTFESVLPSASVIQNIYACNMFGTPIIGVLHVAKIVENLVSDSGQIVVSRIAKQ